MGEREREVKSPTEGLSKRRSQMCKPHESLGYLLDPFFFSLPRQPPNKRKKIHQVSVLTCRQRQGEPGARPRHRRNFWKYKTMHIHNSPIKSASPGRLPSAEAFAAPCPLLFQLCKSRESGQAKTKSSLSIHKHFQVSAVSLFRHPSIGKSGGGLDRLQISLLLPEKQNNPPTPAPRLLRCCCK